MPQIDDPFRPADATVLRPRPGAGRPGAPGGTAPPGAAPPRWQFPSAPAPEPLPPSSPEILGTGLDPLVRAASNVLLLAGRLRGTLSAPDVAGLRRHALDEIYKFEERARSGGAANETVLAARYALCATLDEAVLSTPWGAQSEWAQQTLLVQLHREAWGGEKFYAMLDRISQDPSRHIALMEVQYLCLVVGFTGKYHVEARGDARLAEVRQALYRRIREHHGAAAPELSLRWRGIEDRRNRLIRYVPWWIVGAAALVIVALAYAVYASRLGGAAAPVQASLAKVGLDGFSGPAKPSASGVTLKQLLAPEEARGAVTVEDQQGRTLITLLAPSLFPSGSATLNPDVVPVVRRVAQAIDKVPGRVLVVGHTDDQPVRSLRYRDNFELSRDRAVSVARVLQPAIANPARVEWTGVGSSQPRFRPEADPDNRARNRRVEIVHVP
ncbi:MAG TPA: type IVB secretion system protein IcmH/DotU [Vicinamibacterales bacterium]|jgi:type VI secretion system protein ImpK|nr:type IVB secretion system protein IcmH/DotU [Vicinamibacterales bacterium]